ncbi:MAG TPA: lipoyl synthase [Chloroflexota bacterium]|nr:lipoyl synthase [Chloroflexota bacterium]
MIELAPKRPDWLKVRAPGGKNYNELQMLMRDLALHTVCEEARCPNIGECWGHRTATFMILGDTCTRACGFCAVKTGRPGAVDWGEPERVARAVQTMGLKHVVVTSVNRDDQPDGGSLIFAATIRKIRAYVPGCTVEVLTPDFEGVRASLEHVLRARPDVFNHNVETVERLTKAVRRRAKYRRSLEVLRMAKEIAPGLCTKSGIMVGLGETCEEIAQTMRDLRACDVDILTIGQYLRPTPQHLDIVRYYHPDEFAELKAEGLALGFKHVESGPLVRSSYHAHEHAAIASGQ